MSPPVTLPWDAERFPSQVVLAPALVSLAPLPTLATASSVILLLPLLDVLTLQPFAMTTTFVPSTYAITPPVAISLPSPATMEIIVPSIHVLEPRDAFILQ
jgi:hypothetical protein